MGPLAQSLEELKAHFDAHGAWDLGALAASSAHGRLAAALADLAGFDPRGMRIPAQMAFWLNVYNAAVLRDLLEFEAGEFFARARLRIAGHAWSLDDIEHGLLRGNAPKYMSFSPPLRKSDPRLALAPVTFDERSHFALHYACRSSPPLRVFHAERIEDQLEDASREHVRATVRVKDEGARVKVPKLFQWYAEDFGGADGVLEFVVARLDDESVELIDRRQGRVKIKYLDHDWTLNRLETAK
ncbi:MAG: DUF547 domain-containing protein [Betaproteobacteria bacterium]